MIRVIDKTELDETRWQLRVTDGTCVQIVVARPAITTKTRWEFYAFGEIHVIDDNGKEA